MLYHMHLYFTLASSIAQVPSHSKWYIIRELNCTSWNLFFSHLVYFILLKMRFYVFKSICYILHRIILRLKTLFQNLLCVLYFLASCTLNIENLLIGLNLPYTHTLLVSFLYAKQCLIQVVSYLITSLSLYYDSYTIGSNGSD